MVSPLLKSQSCIPPLAVTSEAVIFKLYVTIAGITSSGLLEAVTLELSIEKVSTAIIPSSVAPLAVTVLSSTIMLLSVNIPLIPLLSAVRVVRLLIFILPAA